ncbi:MAG: hypothetical protein RI894_331 [Bacteroidota bacterium]|jgi:hypothetical protein
MSYNKFKIKNLEENLLLDIVQKAWLPETFEPFAADLLLNQILAFAETEALMTEKARSEFVISPTLQALRRRNFDKFSIFSGYEFTIDKSLNLSGFCDYILSLAVNKVTVSAPVFFVVEAKRLDITDNAIAQCSAEMYAAALFNKQQVDKQQAKSQKVIYGAVTSAFSWCFLKLEGQTLSIDRNYIPLTLRNPYPVLAVLQYLLDDTLRENAK